VKYFKKKNSNLSRDDNITSLYTIKQVGKKNQRVKAQSNF